MIFSFLSFIFLFLAKNNIIQNKKLSLDTIIEKNIQVKIINKSSHPLPFYQTEGSAGMDLYADIENDIELDSLERSLIPTGIHIELPLGYEAQIRPRSGLAFKQGISIVNSPGTVDADYRGEIKVLLVNLSKEKVRIQRGERIAQMVVAKHERVEWKQVESLEELSETERGSGGYGSTGKQ